MKLWSTAFADMATIPGECAFGVIDQEKHVRLSANRNPDFAWQDVPIGTRSLALICHDSDVPSRGDDVNQEGKVIPASLPRVDFFHWVLADLPPDLREIPAGSFSDRVAAGGKPGPEAPQGTHGINDYTAWFAADDAMRGDYYGYDGPCPPWNDELVHRYVFTLYALDIECCVPEGRFGGTELRNAVAGHVLAEAKLTGTYTLNPAATE